MGLFTFLSNLLFGTKEENETVRRQRAEERKRDLERTGAERKDDLATYQRISRREFEEEMRARQERTRELLEAEIRQRDLRKENATRIYRGLGNRHRQKVALTRPPFKPKPRP